MGGLAAGLAVLGVEPGLGETKAVAGVVDAPVVAIAAMVREETGVVAGVLEVL